MLSKEGKELWTMYETAEKTQMCALIIHAFEYGGIASSPVFFHISKSNVSCLLVSLMRFSATLKYLGSFSMPIYCLFSMMAATQVVPLPIVLSKITPPHLAISPYQVA